MSFNQAGMCLIQSQKSFSILFDTQRRKIFTFPVKNCLAERTLGTYRLIHNASLSCFSCSCSAPPSPSSTTSAASPSPSSTTSAAPPPPHPPATAAATCYAAIDGLSRSSSSRSRMTFAQLDQTSSRGRFASTLQSRPNSNSVCSNNHKQHQQHQHLGMLCCVKIVREQSLSIWLYSATLPLS